MAVYIALLRGINLGPHRQVSMADLRDMTTALGFTDPQTLLRSGNLVFRGKAMATDRVEKMFEAEAVKRLGHAIDFFIRTPEEWAEAIAKNPFPDEAKSDPSHLLLVCLKEAPTAASVKALQDAITGRELVRAYGRHAYIVYPDGIGQSKLTSDLADRKMRGRGTGRNWNTVLKLAALAATLR